MKINLQYLCTVIGNLAGIPVRLYKNGKLTYYHSVVNLPKDPICLYIDEMLSKDENIEYFVTPIFNYYGIVRSKKGTVIIGPTRQLANTDQELRQLAFECSVASVDVDDFVIAMKNIVEMPLDSIIQILFTLNHVLNGETLNLKDVRIFDTEQDVILNSEGVFQEISENQQKEANQSNNSYALEQTLMNIVQHGDTASLKQWVSTAPAVKSGIIAHEQIRQAKNTFIVATTLVCRSAIRGGMDVHEALSLSDAYIQKCEFLTDIGKIVNLQYSMVVEYTERVERIRKGRNPSKLVLDVTNYVLQHLSEPIKTTDIAKALFISRSWLSTKFKEEAGITLTEYVLKEKAIEAKRLLRYSNKTIAIISEYLGFSSQSHFNKVFKKHFGISPNEYRTRKQ